jgi:hypothetical protein
MNEVPNNASINKNSTSHLADDASLADSKVWSDNWIITYFVARENLQERLERVGANGGGSVPPPEAGNGNH